MTKLKIRLRMALCACLLFIVLGSGSTVRAQSPTEAIGVFYVGPEDSIAKAIDAAAPYIFRVEQPDPDLAQVVVINNAPIEGSTLEYFGTQIREERMGLVIFCGPQFPTDVAQLNALLGVSAFELRESDSPVVVQPSDLVDDLQNSANWLSAPPLENRTIVINPNMLRSVLEDTEKDPIIQRVRGRTETQVLIVGSWLSLGHNTAWQDWAYFPYMIYRLINDAAQTPRTLSFVNYPASPVPHSTARWGLIGLGIGLLASTVALFYFGRRSLYMRGVTTTTIPGQTIKNPELAWRKVGFHRPLAGLLIFSLWGLLVLIPALTFEQTFLANIFSDHVQVLGIWRDINAWMPLAWLLVDAGVGLAAVRYYAALHVHQPQRAYEYLRFYFWYKLLSSTAQLGIVCLIAIWGLPFGNWAHLTYYLIVYALLQFPGILQVFIIYFQAKQRTDYEQSLRFINTFGVLTLQVIAIAILPNQTWFVRMFQGGISVIVTLAIGTMLAQWLVFFAGAALAHQQGIHWNTLMMPHFDSHVVRRMIGYGLRILPGTLAIAFGLAMQATSIPATLNLNASYPWLLVLIGGFDLLTQNFYQDLLAALTEAYHSNYQVLFRYTISQSIRTVLWWSIFLCAWISLPLMLHVGGDILTDIETLLPFIVWGGLRWLLWLPVTILRSANRPALGSVLIVLEQAALLTILLILPAEVGVAEIGSYYLITLAGAGILGWVMVSRWVTTPRVYLWQSLLVPLVSAMIIFQIMLQLMGVANSPLHAPGIVQLSLLAYPLFLVYAFITALLGGWDHGSLQELNLAVHASILGYPLTWILWHVIRLGAQISPLHNRFPVSLRNVAMEEAELLPLTQDKSR